MPFSVKIPLHFTRLVTINDHVIMMPLSHPEFVWHGSDIKKMPTEFKHAIEREIIKEGRVFDAIQKSEDWQLDTAAHDIQVNRALKSRRSAPLKQRYYALTRKTEREEFITYVPALGIEVYSREDSEIPQDIAANAQLTYIRQDRFAEARRIISTQWYKDLSVEQHMVQLSFPSPKELEKNESAKRESLLKKITRTFDTTNAHANGLETELDELHTILSATPAQSVLITGSEGSGKTALFHKYVQLHSSDRFRSTSATQLLQGLTGETGWQRALAELVMELREQQSILHVGHLVELFEVGQYEGNRVSIGEALKEPIQRGEITVVGEATDAEISALNLRIPGFVELFAKVNMQKKSDKQLETIVYDSVRHIARQCGIELTLEAIDEILRLQRRYTPYSGMPGKPIRFFESLILQNKNKLKKLTRDSVLDAFCEETGMPRFIIDPNLAYQPERMIAYFNERIFGQAKAVQMLANLISSVKAGMIRSGKPVASLMFIGPTGVGKTEMAKTLARFMFGDPKNVIRLDMSEYNDASSVLRLTGEWGSPENSLVSRIRQNPFSVVLLDEIEKAHSSFFDLLLQILGDGRLTDSRGVSANFCSSIVIMTSNIGAGEFARPSMGFHDSGETEKSITDSFLGSIQEYFRPELINRLDQILPFLPLREAEQKLIVNRELRNITYYSGVQDRAIEIEFSDAVADHLVELNKESRYGARQLTRIVHDVVTSKIARAINQITSQSTCGIKIDVADGNIRLDTDIKQKSMLLENSVAGMLDSLSFFRNFIYRILDGVAYNYMLSQLDLLTRKSKKQSFWTKRELVARFNQLQSIQTRTQDLISGINDLETRLFTQSIEETADQKTMKAIGSEFDQWMVDFDLNNLDIFSQSEDDANQCDFAMFGPADGLPDFAKIYSRLFEFANFDYVQYPILLEQDTYKIVGLPLTPDDKKLLLIGYLYKVRGAACVTYLSPESGAHQIHTSKANTDNFYIICQESETTQTSKTDDMGFDIPEGIHRKQYFKGIKPKRVIKDDHMSDREQDWEYPYTPDQLHLLLYHQLLKHVRSVLDNTHE